MFCMAEYLEVSYDLDSLSLLRASGIVERQCESVS